MQTTDGGQSNNNKGQKSYISRKIGDLRLHLFGELCFSATRKRCYCIRLECDDRNHDEVDTFLVKRTARRV